MPIEIFRAGSYLDSRGRPFSATEADLSAIAEGYDPALHEAPIVVGHPKSDAPAYGWVAGLAAEGDRLIAEPRQVDAQFAELVAGGRFKKISASFYLADSPANPKPGAPYLRHVGFLGAQPPAVKGLAAVELGEDEDGVVTVDLGEVSGWSVARALRSLRDFLLAEFGQEKADAATDMTEAMNEIGDHLESKIPGRFETETGPDGVPWAPSIRAILEGGQTLTDQGHLRDSRTYIAGRDFVEAGLTAKYAAMLHHGGAIGR